MSTQNLRQIPKTVEYCANKLYSDILYGYLQNISDWDKDKSHERFFSKKDIKFTKVADELGMTRQTVSKKFNHLIELGLVKYNENTGVYTLTILDKEVAALIPYSTLKLLTDTLNERAVSTFVYLYMRWYANNCKGYKFSIDNIKAFLGLSLKTQSNNEIVDNILWVLKKLQLLDFSLTINDTGIVNENHTIHQLDWIKLEIQK